MSTVIRVSFEVKRGETKLVLFDVNNPDGSPADLSPYTVSLAVDGGGQHRVITGTKDTPNALGTGAFTLVGSDYPVTRRADQRRLSSPHTCEIWLSPGDIAAGTFFFDVVDVPQRV